MWKMCIKTITLFFIYLFFLSGIAFAIENSMLVELPKKINKSIANITRINHQHELKTKKSEEHMQTIINKLQNTSNENHGYALKQEYFATRAENLKEKMVKLTIIENELVSVVKNMEQLEQVRNDSRKFGMGTGIDRRNSEAKKSVQGMLKGFKSMMYMIETLDPNVNLSNQKNTFVMMNSMADSFFNNKSNDSLKIEKEFILESLSLSKSLQHLLSSEYDHLLSCLYYIDSDHIVKQFGKIKQSIFGKGIGVKHDLVQLHSQDKDVLDHGSSNKTVIQADYNTEFSQTKVDW